MILFAVSQFRAEVATGSLSWYYWTTTGGTEGYGCLGSWQAAVPVVWPRAPKSMNGWLVNFVVGHRDTLSSFLGIDANPRKKTSGFLGLNHQLQLAKHWSLKLFGLTCFWSSRNWITNQKSQTEPRWSRFRNLNPTIVSSYPIIGAPRIRQWASGKDNSRLRGWLLMQASNNYAHLMPHAKHHIFQNSGPLVLHVSQDMTPKITKKHICIEGGTK